MKFGFDTKFLEELKSKNDIVEVIGGYIPLEFKSGGYWARCPFHNEKTASFKINERDQFFKCFGCGKGGDVITFVKEYENVDFQEAVKILADRVNMPLPEIKELDEKVLQKKKLKEVCLKILNDTAHFYVDNLKKEERFLEYIVGRGLKNAGIKTFGIGASPDYNALVKHLLDKGYAYEEMIESGVVEKKEKANGENYYYDALGDRLIIPIINAYGEVIAFGGRRLEKVDFGKYKNTKETIVFSKSKTLYNINQIKKLKKENNLPYLIVVEGYMDVISLYMAGIKNVIASMGTALTKDQCRMIKSYASEVYICYDGDGAGKNATIRGIELLEDEGLNVKVMSLPGGLDPDDVIRKYGQNGFMDLLKEALPLIDYKMKLAKDKYDLESVDGKRNYRKEAINLIKSVAEISVQEDLIKKLSKETNSSYDAIKRDVDSIDGKTNLNVYKGIIKSEGGELQAKRFVIYYLLKNEEARKNFNYGEIEFDENAQQLLLEYAKERKNDKINISLLFDYLDESDYDELNKILEQEYALTPSTDKEKYFKSCINNLKYSKVFRDIKELTAQINIEEDLTKRRELQNLLAVKMTERQKYKKN